MVSKGHPATAGDGKLKPLRRFPPRSFAVAQPDLSSLTQAGQGSQIQKAVLIHVRKDRRTLPQTILRQPLGSENPLQRLILKKPEISPAAAGKNGG